MQKLTAMAMPNATCDRARDIAQTDTYVVSRREREKVEMLFAHLSAS